MRSKFNLLFLYMASPGPVHYSFLSAFQEAYGYND